MSAVKHCVRSISRLWKRRRRVRPWQLESMEAKFTAVHGENTWRSAESVSGRGSTLHETEAIRRELPGLIEQIGVRSILDIPCGDFHWMQDVTLDVDTYIGADVVDAIVESNRQFADDRRQFVKLDLTRDPLPEVDLVFCRDCLVHFSYADVRRALANIARSGSKYLATTTFPGRPENHDILTGQWRPLNVQRPPLSFPEPIRLIDERCPMKGYTDKSLGLWRVATFDSV